MKKMKLLKSFVNYYRPHKKLVALDFSSAFMVAALSSLMPYGIKLILDDYLPQRDLKMIMMTIAVIFVMCILYGVFMYVNTRWGHVLGVRMEGDMRADMFAHLQKLSFKYFDHNKTGHIMSRISNDLTLIAEAAHHAPEDLLMALLTLTGAFIFMFNINPLFAAICIIPLPLIVLWGMIFQGRMFRGFRQVRKKVADINSSVENSIQGIREVKSFANEKHEISNFGTVNRQFVKARENVYAAMAGFHSGINVLTQGYSLMIIGAGALMIYYDRAVISDVITFYVYSNFITRPIFQLSGFIEQYQQGVSAFERFVEIMDEQPEINDPPKVQNPATINGTIDISSLWFRYSNDESSWTLRDINMKIDAGQKVALVGESGAGKSTMAALIPRFYEVNKGSILIDGVNIMAMSQRFIRSNIGIVQQQPFLFDSTVRDNISFGKPGASEDEIIQAAINANIYDFIETLPDGLDSEVGEHGVKLSGGQKQRISIARVFLKDPPILIFDEATSALDNESEELIRNAMDRLCQNRTTIIIAHRLSTVRDADYTYVMRDGEIVEHGQHQDLLNKAGYYHHLYSLNTL